MYGQRFFGGRYFGRRYFAQIPQQPAPRPFAWATLFGHRFFARSYWAARYFGTDPVVLDQPCAFPNNAFQNDAFQVCPTAVTTVTTDTGGGGPKRSYAAWADQIDRAMRARADRRKRDLERLDASIAKAVAQVYGDTPAAIDLRDDAKAVTVKIKALAQGSKAGSREPDAARFAALRSALLGFGDKLESFDPELAARLADEEDVELLLLLH